MQVIDLTSDDFSAHRICYSNVAVYQYGNYVYSVWDDVEEDNIKRFHEVKNIKQKYYKSIPLSPYIRSITAETFKRWIDMGMPTREEIGGHHIKDHERHYEKWIAEQLEKELEL